MSHQDKIEHVKKLVKRFMRSEDKKLKIGGFFPLGDDDWIGSVTLGRDVKPVRNGDHFITKTIITYSSCSDNMEAAMAAEEFGRGEEPADVVAALFDKEGLELSVKDTVAILVSKGYEKRAALVLALKEMNRTLIDRMDTCLRQVVEEDGVSEYDLDPYVYVKMKLGGSDPVAALLKLAS